MRLHFFPSSAIALRRRRSNSLLHQDASVFPFFAFLPCACPFPRNCPPPLRRPAVPQSKWLSSGQFKQTTPSRHLPNVFLLCGLPASQTSAGWKEAVALTSVLSGLFPHWEFCWAETNPSAWEPKCPLRRGEPIPEAGEQRSGRGTLLTWTQLGEAAVKVGNATFLMSGEGDSWAALTNVPVDARHACAESLESRHENLLRNILVF